MKVWIPQVHNHYDSTEFVTDPPRAFATVEEAKMQFSDEGFESWEWERWPTTGPILTKWFRRAGDSQQLVTAIEVPDVLPDLIERMERAETEVQRLADRHGLSEADRHEYTRLDGKRDGIGLALSYAREALAGSRRS